MLTHALTMAVVVMGLGAQVLPADQEVAQNSQEARSSRPVADTNGGGGSASALHGVTRNPSGLPLDMVKVLVQAGGNTPDREALSGPDGTFTVEGLKPGRYQVTAQKDGFGSAPSTSVEVASGQIRNLDLTLVAPSTSSHGGNFFGRLARAYRNDWHPSSTEASEAPYSRLRSYFVPEAAWFRVGHCPDYPILHRPSCYIRQFR
jgi:hypothetical protein